MRDNPLRRIDSRAFTVIEVMMGASIMAVVSAALVGAFVGQASLNLTARNLTAAMVDATRVMEEIRKQNTGDNCLGSIPSAAPNAAGVAGVNSWDDWLIARGKSVVTDNITPFEKVAVTCQDATAILCTGHETVACPKGGSVTCPDKGKPAERCGVDGPWVAPIAPHCGTEASGKKNKTTTRAQMGSGEWKAIAANTQYNPIRVTIAVGWVQNERVIGSSDFRYQAAQTTFKQPSVTTPARLIVEDKDNDGVITSQAMVTTIIGCR